jgi:hypothetical protein
MSDQLMLRLLQCLDVTFEAEWGRAEAAYGAGNPPSAEPKGFKGFGRCRLGARGLGTRRRRARPSPSRPSSCDRSNGRI